MTMFERLERLEARMGALEADAKGALAVTAGRLPAPPRTVECSCDSGFDPSEPPPHDHVPCGGTGRVDAPIGALEAISSLNQQDSGPEHARMMRVASMLPPQDPYKELDEARALLEGLRRELDDRGGDLSRKTWNRLDVYCDNILARARVAPKVP